MSRDLQKPVWWLIWCHVDSIESEITGSVWIKVAISAFRVSCSPSRPKQVTYGTRGVSSFYLEQELEGFFGKK